MIDDVIRPGRAGAPAPGPELDFGPALPARYDGGRARALVASPTSLFVEWEHDASDPDAWHLKVVCDGDATLRVRRVEGHTRSAWIAVGAKTRGEVQLSRVEAGSSWNIATLSFETPPHTPSTQTAERWGRLDAFGNLRRDALAVEGEAVWPLDGPSEATS